MPRSPLLRPCQRGLAGSASTHQRNGDQINEPAITKEVRERKQELDRAKVSPYPRLELQNGHPGALPTTINCLGDPEDASKKQSNTLHKTIASKKQGNPLHKTIAGRIVSVRLSGKKLAFFDLQTDLSTTQLMLNHAALSDPKPSEDDFQHQCRLLRRGDHVIVEAKSSKTRDGDPSLQALSLPVLQSPCLQRFPVANSERPSNPDSDSPNERHIDMLTSPDIIRMIGFRHKLVRALRHYLSFHGFIEVQTPILSAQSGGATARPFETTATEFLDRRLALRVAPELWLKRLIIGGLTRVYEIGPCFRNEGLDKTHNPEFTTCEFYAAYWTLDKLQLTTENLLRYLTFDALHRESVKPGFILDIQLAHEMLADEYIENYVAGIGTFDALRLCDRGESTWPHIDFIPALNTLLGVELPNLASSNARESLLEIFETKSIPLPEKPTLPRLLDKLSSQFLEPHCYGPTWIENIPECLSPLAKSFIHPTAPNNQPVAARAELFIRGKEVVNCYEEENDPFEQRRKFVEQQKYARDPESGEIDEEAMKLDEDYIRALEWGLPPTGGWGMGVDRLLMLLTGKDRIADVLTFGNLRAVTRGAEKWGKKEKSEDKHETKEE